MSITTVKKDHNVEALNERLASLLRTCTRGGTTLEGAGKAVVAALLEFKTANAIERIGLVGGIRESVGEGEIERNSRRLAAYTDVLRNSTNFPLFSCLDIYDSDFLARFDYIKTPKDWDKFWEQIFKSGAVTDLYLTPRWSHSMGALYEERLAEEFMVQTHMVDKDPRLQRILHGNELPLLRG